MILKKDGTLWATGDNSNGQLGLGTVDSVLTPTLVSSISDVASVSAGGYSWTSFNGYSMIVKKDGSLWATGYNSDCQLGTGTTATVKTPVQITF
jgi:alpha-tubulin suppressor-like RCC1 family protein